MSVSEKEASNRRIRKRIPMQLRVDVKLLPEHEVQDILDGAGYADLSTSAMALRRPRSGMEGHKTSDVSFSGIGLVCEKKYENGQAAALDVHLPGQRTVLKFLGEVMWTRESNGEYRSGMRFAALDEDSARRFADYLEKNI